MKKLFTISVFCLAAIFSKAQTNPAPVKEIDQLLSFTNADFDMGKIPAGKPLEYTVTIKNIGKDTIVLKEVKAGCGCTTPKYRSNDVILPGKSTIISLGFNGGATGEFYKVADVYFNDGLSKQLRFHGFAVADSATNKPTNPANRR